MKRSFVQRLIAREADDGVSAVGRLITGAASVSRSGSQPLATGGALAFARALVQLANRPLALMPDALLHYRTFDTFDADLQIE